MTAIRLLGRTDVAGGLSVVLLAGLCWIAVGDLDIGTAAEMGPGYIPRALAGLMLVAGVGMTLAGVLRESPQIEPIRWRPVVVVSLSMVVFGLLVDRFGIVVATVLSTAIATLASRISRVRETPWLCVALAALAALAFVNGLGLAIPVWPR